MINYRYSKNKLKYFFRHYSLFLLLIVGTLIVGIIAGSVAVKVLSYQQKEALINYLANFSGELGELLTNQQLLFKKVMISNLKFVLLLWVLGLSLIGIVFVPLIIFFRGFILGFTVGFLVDELFFRGLLLAIIAIFPQNLFIIPALILASLFCLVFVFKILTSIVGRSNLNFWAIIAKYSALMSVVVLILIVAAVIEIYFTPQLINVFNKFLGF